MNMSMTTSSTSLGSRLLVVLLALGLTLLSIPARASIDLPNIPLQSGASVPPNIMFVLDDSGSMQWEIMPDALRGSPTADYVFPPGTNQYEGNNWSNRVLDFGENNFTVPRRSYHLNKTFYNPVFTYQPWVNANGTAMDNASPTAAPYNPVFLTAGTLDLTVQQSANVNWRTSASAGTTANRSFYPATFYVYKGGGLSETAQASYVRYQYRDGQWRRRDMAVTTETTLSSLDWSGMGGPVRTAQEELDNFANWFTYARSRILASRGGIGRAFAPLPLPTNESPAPRVGFGTINAASRSVDNVSTRGVVDGVRPFTTAARQSFFTRLYRWPMPTGSNANTPLRRALDDAGQYFSRQDARGPWNEIPGDAAGEDLSCRQSFTILMTDGYWNNDAAGTAGARENVDNTNGTQIEGPNNPPFTYIASDPFRDNHSNTLADVAMYYWKRDLRPDLANRVPSSSRNPAFWQHMVTYGVGLGVQGSINPETAFAAIESGASISWANPTTDPAKIDDLLHAAVNSRGGFFSAQNPSEFAEELLGVLTSIIEQTSSASNVSTNSTSLDGGTRVYQAAYVSGAWTGELQAYPVTAAGVSGTPSWRASQQMPTAANRTILTNVATGTGVAATGAPFLWSNLTTAQQNDLRGGGTVAFGESVLNYLRGSQVGEEQNGGSFRNRTSRLGDIIHSSPVLVRETGTNPHATIFVGSNGGMLHAFDAATGVEQFAYVPRRMSWTGLRNLTNTNYSHEYFVDGEIAVSTRAQTPDRNILVGTLGRGGKAVYGLDVTNPSAFNNTHVLWEFTDPDLGNVLSKPIIARLQDGTMAAIVGNGYNSTNNRAFLFVINLETGALISKIDTTAGSAAEPNGLSTPRGWDVDADGRIDYVYGGDLLGNLWKFDLTHNNAGQWDVAFSQGQNRFPLFVARDAGGNRQPITGGVSIALDPQSFRRWIFFGTGRYLTTGDPGNQSIQSWYGIIDDGERIEGNRATELLQRSIALQQVVNGRNVRAFEEGDATELVDKMGWYIDLIPPGVTEGQGERIVSDTLVVGSVLLAASIIPTDDPCEVGGGGFINAINPFTGASVGNPFFDIDGDGSFGSGDMIGSPPIPVGSVDLGVGMPTLPAIIRRLLIGGGSGGQTNSIGIDDPTDTGRISWREIVRD